MRFDYLALRGMGVFGGEVEVDLAALPAGLVAVTGPNGSGKSSMLELLRAGVYRSCPTRGTLAGLAKTRDAYLEIGVTSDATYRIRHTVDAQTGKAEVLVLGEDGAPVVASTSVRAFDAWVRDHFPPASVVDASLFAAQQSAGFLGLSSGERKAVLLRVLGVEELEVEAERCRKEAAGVSRALDVTRARITDAQAQALPVEEAARRVESATVAVDLAATAETEAARLEEAARAGLEEARRVEQAIAEVAERRKAAGDRLEQARMRVESIERRIGNNRGVLAERDAIRAAVERNVVLLEEERAVAAAVQAFDVANETARRDIAHAEEKARGLREEARAARARADRVPAGKVQAARDAQASVPGLRETLAQAEAAFEQAERDAAGHLDRVTHGAELRIDALRTGLMAIAMDSPFPVETARGTLTGDDRMVLAYASAPDDLAEANARANAARLAVATATRHLAEAERQAKELPALEEAERTAERERAESASATEKANAIDAEVRAAKEARRERTEARGRAGQRLEAIRQERAALAPLVAKATPLALAEDRLEALGRDHAEASAQVAAAEQDLAAIPSPAAPTLSSVAAQAALDRDVARHRQAVDEHHRRRADVARSEEGLATARATAERLAALDAERARLEEDLSDWLRLAEDLGRDGLQAMLIDAAGPELTTLVNDLLHTCHGPRFTMSIEASRASADGKRTLEGCEVVVLDTVAGREGPGESFSGGERVILGEAVSLALSMLACRRAGLVAPTLVRDETGSALDPENGAVYLAMLRRAAELVGASRVLFVSHDPALADLADGRIDVGALRGEPREAPAASEAAE